MERKKKLLEPIISYQLCCPCVLHFHKNKYSSPSQSVTQQNLEEKERALKAEMSYFHFNFVTLFIFVAFIVTLVKKRKRSEQLKKLPPGPWKLPVIGNIHHLIGLPPHHILKTLAEKHGALMHLQLGEISAIVVSSPRLAEEIMKTHDLAFANRPELLVSKILCYNSSDIVFSPYGEYWRQLRKICTLELLSAKNVRSFGSIRQDEAFHLISSIRSLAANGSPINLTKTVSAFTSSIICRAAFGNVCRDDQNKFIQLMKETIALTGGFDISDLFPSWKILHGLSRMKPKLLMVQRKFDTILDSIINQHIENLEKTRCNGESGNEDLIDVLLRVKIGGDLQFPLTKSNIKAVVFDMFTGGTETSSTTVEWAMAEMIKNPNVMAKAQDEVRKAFMGKKTIEESDIQGLSYLKLVIKETLRLHPPVPLLVPRECREECEIDGYIIPLKTRVLINVWAIGRDPAYWNDPDIFQPERFEQNSVEFTGVHFEYLPFGAGRRVCPGLSFGLANIELPLAMLLYHFEWKLPDSINSGSLDMTETCGMTAARKNNLILAATSYDPSHDPS